MGGGGGLGTSGACAEGGLGSLVGFLPEGKNIQIHTRTNGETLKTLTDHHLNTLQPQRFTPPPPKNKSGKKARHPVPTLPILHGSNVKMRHGFLFHQI